LQNFGPSRFRLIRRSLVTSEIMHAHARNRLADELRRRMRACTDRANLTTLQRLLHLNTMDPSEQFARLKEHVLLHLPDKGAVATVQMALRKDLYRHEQTLVSHTPPAAPARCATRRRSRPCRAARSC
jgi:hypothetical protein